MDPTRNATTVHVIEVFDADGDRDDLLVHATREGAVDEAEVAIGGNDGWTYEIHEERLWGGDMGPVEVVEADR